MNFILEAERKRSEPKQLFQIPKIYEGLENLLSRDPVFSKLKLKPKDLDRPFYGTGFRGLCRIVIGQQVSTQAADALWTRFQNGLPNVTPNAVAVLKVDEMRSLGLSHQKARYIQELARAIQNDKFDPYALEQLSDDEVTAQISALKGFGPWSIQIFLMFCLARPDVLPAGDLGIQEGLRIYHDLPTRPDEAQTAKLGEAFAPNRTAASILLWHLKHIGKKP